MKHRRLASLLLVAALALAACTPAEGDAGPEASSPAPADLYDGY